jgi:hypothetical protein
MEDLNEAGNAITESLKKKLFDYLAKANVSIPGSVETSINQVFDENTFTSDDDNIINVYDKNELEDFEQETMMLTQLNVQVRGGNSSGDVLSKYTYYGNLETTGAYSENIAMYDGETLVEQVRLIEPKTTNHLDNPNDWCVVLIEEKVFEMGNYEVTPRLYVYVPMAFKPKDEEAGDAIQQF